MFEFAYVHHNPDHIEIVNITKNPLDPEVYTFLEVTRPESPNIKIFCRKDCVDEVTQFYTVD